MITWIVERFEETQLPRKEEFYGKLKNEHMNERDVKDDKDITRVINRHTRQVFLHRKRNKRRDIIYSEKTW